MHTDTGAVNWIQIVLDRIQGLRVICVTEKLINQSVKNLAKIKTLTVLRLNINYRAYEQNFSRKLTLNSKHMSFNFI
jgi:hypothetical protein